MWSDQIQDAKREECNSPKAVDLSDRKDRAVIKSDSDMGTVKAAGLRENTKYSWGHMKPEKTSMSLEFREAVQTQETTWDSST